MSSGSRRLGAVILGFVVAGTLMVIVPGTAAACSCMMRPLAERMSVADVVFVGAPTAGDVPTTAVSSADPVRWTFKVEAVHKGAVGRIAEVESALDDASCGIRFALHRRYLVFGVINDGAVTAGLCGGTERLDDIPADVLASLGAGSAPAENAPIRPAANGDGRGGTVAIAVVFAAAVILTLGMVVVRRRSHPP